MSSTGSEHPPDADLTSAVDPPHLGAPRAEPVEPTWAEALHEARKSVAEAALMRPRPDPGHGPSSTDHTAPPVIIDTVDVRATVDTSTTAADAPTFERVLSQRRSRRQFGPLDARQLCSLLDTAFALTGFAPADDGGVRRFRPIPSAGARHPISAVVLTREVSNLADGLWVLDADAAKLHRVLAGCTSPLTQPIWDQVTQAGGFTQPPPAVVFLVARFEATLARYRRGNSLVWRDAGAAMAVLNLIATSKQLHSCPLGSAGVLAATTLTRCGLGGQFSADVGAIAVGGPTPPHPAPRP